MSGQGNVTLNRQDQIAYVLFDRAEAHNAMTPKMYQQLDDICIELGDDPNLRAVIFRGSGGKAFVAGSDIAGFLDFKNGEDGVAYEAKMDGILDNILAIPVPVIGVLEGWVVGGGLNIAACCDIRIATDNSRFGVPIAKTIGNCLSMKNYARLVSGFGVSRAKQMLFLGDMLSAEQANEAGFLARVCNGDDIDQVVAKVINKITSNAPLTLKASKEAIRRTQSMPLPSGEDLILKCYGSEDFHTGINAFVAKQVPDWSGK